MGTFDITNSIYHNFFSVCALIPAAFMLSLGVILLKVPHKSKATLHLAITYILLMLFYSGYIISAMVYHPVAAYHRWITTGFVTLTEIHFIMAFFYLPEDRNPRFVRLLGGVLYTISLASWAAFIVVTFHAPKIYNFDGHYWDFDADAMSTYIAVLIIAYLGVMVAVGLWRMVITKTKIRWTIFAMVIIVLITIIIPAMTNLLSRKGLVDRGTYQITQDLFTIAGFFAVFIIFFNTTRERTSLLVKILGICYATLLFMIQGVSYYTLRGLDDSYDELKKKDMSIAIDTDRHVPDLSYLARYSLYDGRIEMRKCAHDSCSMDLQGLRGELFNTLRLEQIRMIAKQPVSSYRMEIGKVLAGCGENFNGYREAILAKINSMPAETADPGPALTAHIASLQRRIENMSRDISRLPDAGFAGNLRVYLNDSHTGMEHFAEAIRSFSSRTGHDGPALKQEVLSFLAPMHPAGTRRYRIGKNASHHVAYMEFDPARQVIHEAGFSYRAYREYHHHIARKFIIMIGIVLILTFAGFRFFFLGAYIRPLRRILKAINQVRSGNYDIVIPITVNDEMGYISHNFNEMAGTLQLSRDVLSDYAENLQKMVEERTRELEKARDTIWGEMEVARKMQTILIPSFPRMEGYAVAGYMAPAEMVGGDYYDIINVAGMDWVIIGDVSGHGVPAGIIMMMVQTSIHTILAGSPDIRPSELLDRVNTVITENIQKLREDKYMTITVIACLADGCLLASGLHQDILVYRSRTNEIETFKTCGILLGLKGVIDYVPSDRELLLERDDVMVLYTDGVTETWKKGSVRNHRNPRTDMFGQDRLAGILRRHRAGSPEEIRDAILGELEGYHCIDDVTMVIIKKK